MALSYLLGEALAEAFCEAGRRANALVSATSDWEVPSSLSTADKSQEKTEFSFAL